MPAKQIEIKEVIRFRGDKPFKPQKEIIKAISDKKDSEIINDWFLKYDENSDQTAGIRDAISSVMTEKKIYPTKWASKREIESGLYPDIQDPKFASRLYTKQEFFEARAAAISALQGTDPCNEKVESVFEISPIQRLVSRFLNPSTPYNGLLLYHGVGVGKTCSAIRVAEEYLRVNPHSKVFIVVPKSISGAFRRTMFDASKIKKENGQWVSNQCTGLIYPELALQDISKKDLKGRPIEVEDIADSVEKILRERYFRFGYLRFANWIMDHLRRVPSHLEGEERISAENMMIKKLFSDKLIIIDEAHNLRDAASVSEAYVGNDEPAADGDDEEDESLPGQKDDITGGKKLTPLIKRIAQYADGLKILLMSATPMYNKASEITHLLNLLIINDIKDNNPKRLVGDIFKRDGTLKKDGANTLRMYSQRYISHMRGENPFTFPLRLRPFGLKSEPWPPTQRIGDKEVPIKLSKEENAILEALPIIRLEPEDASPMHARLLSVLHKGDPEDFKGETWVHLDVSNIVYANGKYGHTGWDSYFKHKMVVAKGGEEYRGYEWRGEEEDLENVDSLFGGDFYQYSPKMATILDKLEQSQGISFVYSRYVKAGILPLAVAMERKGWTRVFNGKGSAPLFLSADRVSRRCALCTSRENAHSGKSHKFTPACYILLTGAKDLTPNLNDTLTYATIWDKEDKLGPEGGIVKAILGSQITQEGLDLKCIRAIHILDPWYHLNRLEQIIGRGIRFCSHASLPEEKRNCTIYEYAVSLGTYETPDLHAYRLSATKAKAIGIVQREIKIGAMDCNLNIAGLIVRGAKPRRVVDAEGNIIEQYDFNEVKEKKMPKDVVSGPNNYTSNCDYMENCLFSCNTETSESESEDKNTKTYTYQDARRRLLEKERILKNLFSKEIAWPLDQILTDVYGDLPWEIRTTALVEILTSSTFKIKRDDGLIGNLIMNNGYLLFQPLGVRSKEIPIAYRYSKVYDFLPRTELKLKSGQIINEFIDTTENNVNDLDEEEEEQEENAVQNSEPIDLFTVWMAAVDDILGKPKTKEIGVWKPENLPLSQQQIDSWHWLLWHFHDVPEMRAVAASYWCDFGWNAAERKAVLVDLVKKNTPEKTDNWFEVEQAFKLDVFTIGKIRGFAIIDDAGLNIEFNCIKDGALSLCASNLNKLIFEKIGGAVDVTNDTGGLFGFIVPSKGGKYVFKTLDKVKSTKRTGAVGAECAIASDLGGHQGRVRDIQTMMKKEYPKMAPFMMEDSARVTGEKKKGKGARQERQEKQSFSSIYDFNHSHICLYMEVLLRIMDAKSVAPAKGTRKRWFLNAIEANRAGLTGRV